MDLNRGSEKSYLTNIKQRIRVSKMLSEWETLGYFRVNIRTSSIYHFSKDCFNFVSYTSLSNFRKDSRKKMRVPVVRVLAQWVHCLAKTNRQYIKFKKSNKGETIINPWYRGGRDLKIHLKVLITRFHVLRGFGNLT